MSGAFLIMHETRTHRDTRARNRMKSVIMPLLEGIALECGFSCVTLIAGTPPVNDEDPYMIANVHYGECKDPIPVDFQAFDPEGYSGHVLGQFAKFLSAVGGRLLDLANRCKSLMNYAGKRLPENTLPTYAITMIEIEKPSKDTTGAAKGQARKSRGRRKANAETVEVEGAATAQTTAAVVDKQPVVAVAAQQTAHIPKARPRARPVPQRSQASPDSAADRAPTPVNDVTAGSSDTVPSSPLPNSVTPNAGNATVPLVFGATTSSGDIPIDPILLSLDMAASQPASFFSQPSVPSINGYALTGGLNTVHPSATPPLPPSASQSTTDTACMPTNAMPVVQPAPPVVPPAAPDAIVVPAFEQAFTDAPEWLKSKYNELHDLTIDDRDVAAAWSTALQTWTIIEFVMGYESNKVCSSHLLHEYD